MAKLNNLGIVTGESDRYIGIVLSTIAHHILAC